MYNEELLVDACPATSAKLLQRASIYVAIYVTALFKIWPILKPVIPINKIFIWPVLKQAMAGSLFRNGPACFKMGNAACFMLTHTPAMSQWTGMLTWSLHVFKKGDKCIT